MPGMAEGTFSIRSAPRIPQINSLVRTRQKVVIEAGWGLEYLSNLGGFRLFLYPGKQSGGCYFSE